ncbi:MAG: alpha/beta hydrolase [Solirubrobacterales bacterium]
MAQTLPSPGKPAERGVHEGRPYLVWLPRKREPPWPGMVIVHGAGSQKENHGDFGRACAAAGWAALAYDQRGHGASDDEMSPRAVSDAAVMARFLADRPEVDAGRVCIRGSSMGGFVAIHAAATSGAIAGVVAICPASEQHLLRGLRDDTLEFRAGPEARADLRAWLGEHDLREAVELIGERPLLLIHADGDERIPAESSRELHRRATTPAKKLIVLPGGHHRSAQHDPELQGIALRWLARSLPRRR